MNLGVGSLIHKMSTYWLVLAATVITLAAPLLLAMMDKDSSYWVAAFPAMCLMPLSADGEFSYIYELTVLTFKKSAVYCFKPCYL